MRKFQDSIFSVIERNNYAICPPQKNCSNLINEHFNQLIFSKVAFAVSLIFTTSLSSAGVIHLEGKDEYRLDEPHQTVDGIEASIQPNIENSQFTFSIEKNQSLTVIGDTKVESVADAFIPSYDEGTYLFRVVGGGELTLNGNVNITAIHPKEQADGIGNNVFWADEKNSLIKIGNKNTVTKAWALAKKPDLISAKNGAEVKLISKRNQLVGNIDTLDTDFGTKGSKVSGTFSGSDSYWFGDEQTFQNFKKIDISVSVNNLPISMELKDTADIKKLLKLDYVDLIVNKEILEDLNKDDLDPIITGILTVLGISGKTEVTDSVDLIFENGAQWTYFGDRQILNESQSVTMPGVKVDATAVFESTPKRISAITLNGGIINLYDEDIQRTWEEVGLTDKWSDVKNIEHDYVRIGKLKGNGGIFRLDLKSDEPSNSDEPSQSDMIFIESSDPEEPGQHFIEPYRPEDLTSVSDTNRLTFALTAKGANSVSFADKQNIYGNSLFDYELIIGHEPITIDEDNKDLIDTINKELVGIYKDFDDFNIEDYNGGTHWYIKRLLTKESAASIGMRSAGYASYDLAVNMDRRDRRLQNAVFQNEEKDGLWARVQYGEAGAEHLYNADLTTVYVGYEKATSADNRLGFSFAYTDGESDLNDLKGSGDLKRYEASVYDTLTFGSHYLDFVARFGQVDNEFDVTNQSGALTTTGSFDQKYAALSAEYGYNFKDEHNVFIEPQVQLQVAYLGDYNYRTERNMKVDADSDISVIGRVGLRTGKTFESSDYVGELYARADVLHQFTDGQDAQFSDLSDKINVTWGNKDTWSTFGVGGYLNWKDNMSFQVDVERTAGGETIDTWLVSGRVNYLF